MDQVWKKLEVRFWSGQSLVWAVRFWFQSQPMIVSMFFFSLLLGWVTLSLDLDVNTHLNPSPFSTLGKTTIQTAATRPQWPCHLHATQVRRSFLAVKALITVLRWITSIDLFGVRSKRQENRWCLDQTTGPLLCSALWLRHSLSRTKGSTRCCKWKAMYE